MAGEAKRVEELGTFDEILVWNHDVPWDAAEDAYARGIDEWISFANAVSIPTHLRSCRLTLTDALDHGEKQGLVA